MYDPTIHPPRTFGQLAGFVLLYGYIGSLGAVGLGLLMAATLWPQWRVNNLFQGADGLVVGRRDVRTETGEFRQVRLRYQAGGAGVEHWSREFTVGMDEGQIQRRTRELAVGDRLPVWYDPAAPEYVTIERGYWVHWMVYPIFAGTGFFLIYGFGKVVAGVKGFLTRTRERAGVTTGGREA